jgi:hypothetical protein
MSRPRRALPHGAKGIYLGEDAVVFAAKDKIIFTQPGAADHVTVHMGPATRVLDVHAKWSLLVSPTVTRDSMRSRMKIFPSCLLSSHHVCCRH